MFGRMFEEVEARVDRVQHEFKTEVARGIDLCKKTLFFLENKEQESLVQNELKKLEEKMLPSVETANEIFSRLDAIRVKIVRHASTFTSSQTTEQEALIKQMKDLRKPLGEKRDLLVRSADFLTREQLLELSQSKSEKKETQENAAKLIQVLTKMTSPKLESKIADLSKRLEQAQGTGKPSAEIQTAKSTLNKIALLGVKANLERMMNVNYLRAYDEKKVNASFNLHQKEVQRCFSEIDKIKWKPPSPGFFSRMWNKLFGQSTPKKVAPEVIFPQEFKGSKPGNTLFVLKSLQGLSGEVKLPSFTEPTSVSDYVSSDSKEFSEVKVQRPESVESDVKIDLVTPRFRR